MKNESDLKKLIQGLKYSVNHSVTDTIWNKEFDLHQKPTKIQFLKTFDSQQHSPQNKNKPKFLRASNRSHVAVRNSLDIH